MFLFKIRMMSDVNVFEVYEYYFTYIIMIEYIVREVFLDPILVHSTIIIFKDLVIHSFFNPCVAVFPTVS